MTIDRLRNLWRQQIPLDRAVVDRDVQAWLVSMVVNLLLLWTLALVTKRPFQSSADFTFAAVEAADPVDLSKDMAFAEQPTAEPGAAGSDASGSALPLAPTLDSLPEIAVARLDSTQAIRIEAPSALDVRVAPTMHDDLVVKGAVGVAVTGAEGAIDRITNEIMASLENRPTLVVWIFDQSGSLQPQRTMIQERLERIYRELDGFKQRGAEAFRRHGPAPLLSAVVAFGNEITFRTPQPTEDFPELQAAVAAIENDPTGVERVFAAVRQSAERFRKFRTQSPQRNVMLIVFSDEAGDDDEQLDSAVTLCTRNQMPVYVVGVPAPFGRQEVLMRYVDPDPNFDQSEQMLPVHQGPETLRPELLQIGFSGVDRDDELERMDSGFGPFGLTRLCEATGGIYFAVHPNRPLNGQAGRARGTSLMATHLSQFFDSSVMRSYRPDYVTVKEYQQRLAENKARAALVEAARISWIEPMENPRTFFPRRDEADLKRLLDEAQRPAARIEGKLTALYESLKKGLPDRARLTEPRWQAGFDLALGRVLAVVVRTTGYNAILAKAKNGMKFENPDSDTWILTPSDETDVNSTIEKMAEESRTLLRRVRDEHAGTPWSLIAARELQQPLGWKWVERHTGVNEPRVAVGNGNPAPPPPDQLNKLDKPKPKRPNVRL